MEVKSQILNINISPSVHDLTELKIGRYEFTEYIQILVLFLLQHIGKFKINLYSHSSQEGMELDADGISFPLIFFLQF